MALQPVQQEFDGPGAGLTAYDNDLVSMVAAKAYTRIVAAWKLNNRTAADLIAVSPRTWARMKTGEWSGKLSRDQLLRVSAITGLFKALHLFYGDALADRWVGLRNKGAMFSGRQPVEIMIEGGLPVIMEIRNHVDALRGGA